MKMTALLSAPLLALLALPAAASPSPAATCAAFWLGWSDAAARLAVLPADPADAALGAAFRAAALAEGAAPAGFDGWLRGERRSMARLVTAAVRGDAPSQDLLETLARGCEEDARRRGLI
jgi:hypothetical protein